MLEQLIEENNGYLLTSMVTKHNISKPYLSKFVKEKEIVPPLRPVVRIATPADIEEKVNEILEERGKPFNKRKATTDHWYSIAMGSSECHISIDLVNKEHKIRVGVWIYDNKELFDKFYANKAEIEEACGFELAWDRLENKKASLACTYIQGLDFDNQVNYPELINKAIDLVLTMRKAFVPFVK